MWTSKNRRRYDRSKLRYPSDLTDDEWTLVEHLIPPGKPGGGKRTVIMREVVNGLMYVLSTGCQWRAVPNISICGLMTAHWSGSTTRASILCCTRLAMRKLQREQDPKSPYVFVSERGAPFSTAGFARMVERAGTGRPSWPSRRIPTYSGMFVDKR